MACNLNDDWDRSDFVEIKTLEDEYHLNGTPTAGENDHNDDHLDGKACDTSSIQSLLAAALSYHSGDFLLGAKAFTVISPGNAVHPEAFKHKQIQPNYDKYGKDEGEEKEDHLVNCLIVLVHQEGAHGVFIIVSNIVRHDCWNAKDNDDRPHDENGTVCILHCPPLDWPYWMSNG